MNRMALALLVPLVVAAWLMGVRAGQKSAGELPVGGRPGKPVATFDGQSISAEELKAQIEEQTPFVRARYAAPEARRDFLMGVVRFELMAREAQKKGYQNDPDVVRQHKKNLAALYVQREFDGPLKKQAFDEAELRRYYDEHRGDYVRPERVRVAQILLAAPVEDAARRKARRAEADLLLGKVREKDAKDFGAFAQVAREASEDPESRSAGGDLRFLSREELEKRVGPEAAEVAFALREVGKVHAQVVESPQGFRLLKLLGREAAVDTKLEDARDAIRLRLAYDRRGKAYAEFVGALEKRAGLTIDMKALEAIQIDLGAPTPVGPPSAPMPARSLPVAPGSRAPAPPPAH